MGLTENQKRLIQSISQNDIRSARKCAIACITEDTTAKNRAFCNRYKTLLESSGMNMLELPSELKGIICVEDTSNSFKENRYFLSNRELGISENIIKMNKVTEKMSEVGIQYINSTLLYGESGTGKTTFGRYMSYITNLPFCYINFSNLVESYMGNTSKNISKAFSYAIQNPCVLMLDEIDCISIRRSDSNNSGGANGEMARITISLMQEFDKLPNNAIVIGATNRIDRIDEALLRRFTLKHEIKRLNIDEREQMVLKFFNDIEINISEEQLSSFINPDDTQSGLMNRMVMFLVDYFMKGLEE